jgi:hypothetical protein
MRAGSLERDQPLSPHTNPWGPARKWKRREHFRPEGREGLRTGKPVQRRWRRMPWRGEHSGGQGSAAPVFGRRPTFPFPVRVNLWSRGRPQLRQQAEERQERRGPERGTAGREEKGPEGRTPWTLWRSTGRRQAWRGESRREGSQTLRAEGAGAWNPRVSRTHQAGLCRRGRNPRRAGSLLRKGTGSEDLSLQRRAKGRIGDQCARLRAAEAVSGRPQGGEEPRRGSAEPHRRYRREESMELGPTPQECDEPSGNERPSVFGTRKTLEGHHGPRPDSDLSHK